MLNIINLKKTYDGKYYAINNISFTVGQSQIVSLLGHNGAGKSSILKITASILAPTEGGISIKQVLTHKANKTQLKEMKRNIGYLPEQPFLINKLTPEEYLYYIGKLYGINNDQKLKARIIYLIDLFNIDNAGNKFIDEYSFGLKKRIAIASILINNPELLLLDEPTNNLDPIGVKLLKEHLFELKKNGASILLATHRLEMAEIISDKIVIIDKGEKKFDGSLVDLSIKYQVDTQHNALERIYMKLTKQ